MKIFVAGATGAIGRQLVPMLVAGGHTVFAMSRHAASAAITGAVRVPADAFDRDSVLRAIDEARPDVLVIQLTALPGGMNLRHIDRDFALTNRLRTEGTNHLLEAAQRSGVKHVVAQGFAGWPYTQVGSHLRTEEDPLELLHAPAKLRETVTALAYVEKAVRSTGIPGVVLRYGPFYGPGTSIGPGGAVVEAVRHRRVPITSRPTGVWTFCHIEDAAAATVRAIELGATGIFNVVDDTPLPSSEWIPALARAAGAPPPIRLPAWLARWAVGEAGMAMMNGGIGVSNAKARAQLGWRPRFPDVREGFEAVLAPQRVAKPAHRLVHA